MIRKLIYQSISLSVLTFFFAFNGCKDEVLSNKASLLSFESKALDQKEVKKKSSEKDFNIDLQFKTKKTLAKQKIVCTIKYSEKAIARIGTQKIPNGKNFTLHLKKVSERVYELKENLKILAQDCITEKEYQIKLNILNNKLSFNSLKKIYSRSGSFTTAEIIGNITGEKTDYTIKSISSINPTGTASVTGTKPNLSLKMNKTGKFTATIVMEHPTEETITIEDASFEIIGNEVPIIQGTPLVGKKLSIKNVPTPPSGWTLEIKWYREGSSTVIGTNKELTLQASDIGKKHIASFSYVKGATKEPEKKSAAYDVVINHPNKPSITGRSEVGNTLNARFPTTPTNWTATVKWYRQDSGGTRTLISGATGTTYDVTSTDIAYKIVVSIQWKYNATGETTNEVFSDPTDEVSPSAPKPIITGIPINGNELSITNVPTPPSGWTLEIKWYRKGSSTVISTNDKITLTSADVGKQHIASFSYVKGAAKSTAQKSDAYETIIDHPTKPTISGTPEEHQTLRATLQTAPTGWTRVVKWYRSTLASPPVDNIISGSTGATHLLTRADVNHTVKVSIQFTKGSWKTKEVFSDPTTEIIPIPVKPTISGCGSLGNVDGIIANLETPPAPWVRVVRWYADGVLISGVTDKKYDIVRTHIGKKISVGIQFVKGALRSKEVKSDASRNAIFDIVSSPIKPIITGNNRVGSTLTASNVPSATPSGWNFSIEWKADKKVISGANTRTYTLTDKELNKKIEVVYSFRKLCEKIETASDLTPIITR